MRTIKHPIAIFLFWFTFTYLAVRALTGCSLLSSVPPRSQARAAVIVTAEAVKIFGESCARYVVAHDDLPLAEKCADAYTTARIALISLASGVDAWEKSEVSRETIVCGLRRALAAIWEPVKILEANQMNMKTYDDALSLVSLLGACTEVEP